MLLLNLRNSNNRAGEHDLAVHREDFSIITDEALREPFRRSVLSGDDIHADAVAVITAWQRREISGLSARQLVGARSYGDLYRILRDNKSPVAFTPGDVARWGGESEIPRAKVAEIMGIHDAEIDAFIAAWTATDED